VLVRSNDWAPHSNMTSASHRENANAFVRVGPRCLLMRKFTALARKSLERRCEASPTVLPLY